MPDSGQNPGSALIAAQQPNYQTGPGQPGRLQSSAPATTQQHMNQQRPGPAPGSASR
jgi:hypothetical protein